jgi:hypothetical protein
VLTGNNPPPPHTHAGALSATKLLAVLTGNTDATGSTETPHKRRPNPLPEATSYHDYKPNPGD